MRRPYTVEKRQFLVLYRSFLMRVIDLELMSANADTARLLGQFAALFAGMSYLFTFWLIFAGGFSRDFFWKMEHFLIATTMVVVSLFSVLCWDSIFPDKGDVLVLAPMPVRPSTLFRAKLAALIAALSLSVVSLNIFSGVVWPFLFSITNGGHFIGVVRSLAAYWITMVLAGLFMFCCVLGVQGVTSLVLPRQLFLRLSALLQVAAFFLFFGVYILEPSLQVPRALALPENLKQLTSLPSYWFFGLFQQLNGSMLPEFALLARRAWEGLAVAICGGVASVLLAYFQTMQKVVEEPDIMPGVHRIGWTLRFGSLLKTCVTLFSFRTLLRSRQHRVLLSFYLGTGLAIVLAYVKTPLGQKRFLHGPRGGLVDVALLVASLWTICFAVLGVRVVIAMPHTLRANWIFRMTETRSVPEYVAAVRRSLVVMALAPVWLLLAVLFLFRLPTLPVVGHLIALGLVGMIVVEFCLYGFHKLPFACSYLPGQSKVHVVFWGLLLVIAPLSAARFEARMLHRPFSYLCIIALLAMILVAARWRTNSSAQSAEELVFEEEYPPELLALGLDGR
ncbi:MAG: hypothetical protein ABI286_07315 [Edaphobacter sp.]